MENDLRADHANLDAAEVGADPESSAIRALQDLSERVEALLAAVGDVRRYPQRLWIRSRGQVRILDVDEIDWVEAAAKCSLVHTRDATHRLRESIGRVEGRLDPARFARIHRSAIVNLDRVAKVLSSDGSPSVILRDGTRISMSRSQMPHVVELAVAD